MVSLFRKPAAELDLDGRIAGLARRRGIGQPGDAERDEAVTGAAPAEPALPVAGTSRRTASQGIRLEPPR